MNTEGFFAVEKKYNLYQLQVRNIYVWYYLRNQIWQNDICRQTFNMGIAQNSVSGFRRTKDYIKMITKSFHMSWKAEPAKVAVFCAPHRILQNGKYKCPYTDDLISALPDCAAFENHLRYQHLKPTVTENINYTDSFFIKARFQYYFEMTHQSKFRKIIGECREALAEPLSEIASLYEINLDVEKYCRYAATFVIYNPIMASYFKKMLEPVHPKVIIEVCHFNNTNMLMNEVAGQLGIKTVELMHGNLRADTIAYSYASTSVPFGGIPDYLFTFSDYWTELSRLPKNNVKVISTGFHQFNERRKRFKRCSDNSGKTTILFVSQGTIGSQLSRLAVEISKLIDMEKYEIIYKLHPGETPVWREKYGWLKNSDIQVVTDSDKSIYDFFSISEFLIGVYSTTIYEAVGCGLKTFIYDIAFADEMELLVKKGYASFIRSAEDFVKYLNVDKKQVIEFPDRMSGLWKEDAICNMVNEIEHIINEMPATV